MRAVIERFLDRICEEVDRRRPARILDIGCGEGLVAARLAARLGHAFQYRGVDINPHSVELARELNREHPQLQFDTADIMASRLDADGADLVMCLEVLEHLPEPFRALQRIVALSADTVIVSGPWEPWFQLGNLLRGRHIRRFGNHPEHLHRFRPRTFRRFLSEADPNARVHSCFPWLIGTLDSRGVPARQ